MAKVTEPPPPVEPVPPSCNERYGSSCRYVYAHGRWSLVIDGSCPQHAGG